MYVVCFPHTHALSPYSHILSYFIDLLELLSTWIRALNIFCSPNHCESRGHFHLGLRRLWPQDFQRLSEVQRPNISSSTALWRILRFHGLYRIDRFLRPDTNLSNIITYRGCCERRSSKEKALTFTSTESKVRKLPFCIMAAKSFLSRVHTSILIPKSQKYEGGTVQCTHSGRCICQQLFAPDSLTIVPFTVRNNIWF